MVGNLVLRIALQNGLNLAQLARRQRLIHQPGRRSPHELSPSLLPHPANRNSRPFRKESPGRSKGRILSRSDV
jgi:hypothetical protein